MAGQAFFFSKRTAKTLQHSKLYYLIIFTFKNSFKNYTIHFTFKKYFADNINIVI